ncbi:MAG TPA: hypothetical protein VEK11_26130 [Thermoanaerobaculia bacterium]|jgi:hypothetical protein|nr:hypothetical protein [Thermoanaerobaculia bacterium]
MNDTERAEVLVTARLLRAASAMQWVAVVLTSYAVITHAYLAIALGVIALYFAFRVSFDARLFEDVTTDRLTTSALDAALSPLRRGDNARTTDTPRPWPDRCRGARRLVLYLALTTVALILALALRNAAVPAG